MSVICDCGHAAIAHHGQDAREGCLGVISRLEPPCPCGLIASAVER